MRAASLVWAGSWLALFFDGGHADVLEMTVGSHSVRYTSSGGVDAFLGVRYALPPLGQRRFAPAELMHHLPTDATQYGAPCLQDPSVDPNETPQPEAPLPSEGAFERSSRSTNELALGARGPSLRGCRLFVPQHLAAGECGGPAASGYGPAPHRHSRTCPWSRLRYGDNRCGCMVGGSMRGPAARLGSTAAHWHASKG
jgi:hypothetical protein